MLFLSKNIRLLILPAFLLWGCQDNLIYPNEPVIEFDSFVADGYKGILTINFTDGDGDIGYRENNSTSNSTNFYLEYQEKVNGNWVTPVDSSGNPMIFPYEIFYLTPEGQNKALKGKIEVTIQPYYYNPWSNNSDTIRFKIKIVDRALHESNVVITNEIIP